MTKRGFLWLAGATIAAGIAAVAEPVPAGAESGADDSMKVELGRRLFFDPALGRRGRVGCAECHLPEKGFSDPRERSQDEDRVLPRHSQPSVDLAGDGFHWDGEFPTVRDLIDSRVLPTADARARADDRRTARVAAAAAAGHAPPSTLQSVAQSMARSDGYAGGADVATAAVLAQATPVAARLAEDARYDEGFRLAFGDAAITPQRVGDAVDAYVRSLRTTANGLDRFLAGDQDALSSVAQRGLDLFRGAAGCAECHVVEAKDGRALLTDGKFHDTGVAFRGGGRTQSGNQALRKSSSVDVGRSSATLLPDDEGSFKTPSLRDVARRGPFMHDGSFASLADVVAYYDQGGTPNAHLDPRVHTLGLSANERADLVAFLESLSGAERTGLGDVPAYRPGRLRVHVEGLDSKPVAATRIRVVPCGDRLRGTDAMPEAFDAFTDGDGVADVAFPKSTHVRLEADGVELGMSRPIPDWVASTTLVATPKTVVAVRVRRSSSLAELPKTLTACDVSRTAGVRRGASAAAEPPLTLTRVRSLSDDEAIYTIAVERADRRSSVALFDDVARAPLGFFEVDFSGGASETIDLAKSEAVQAPTPLSESIKRRFQKGLAAGVIVMVK